MMPRLVLRKSRIREYTKHTKSGKMAIVHQHVDKRVAKPKVKPKVKAPAKLALKKPVPKKQKPVAPVEQKPEQLAKPTVSAGMRKLLSENKIVQKEQIINEKRGINDSWKITLEQDGDALCKEQSQETHTGRKGVRPGGQAPREALTYDIAEVIGYEHVPPTVLRETNQNGEPSPSSVQQWINDTRTLTEATKFTGIRDFFGTFNKQYIPQISELAAFDYLMGNTDRHDGNVLLGKDKKVWAIDNGLNFSNSAEDYNKSETAIYFERKHTRYLVLDEIPMPTEFIAKIEQNQAKIHAICDEYQKKHSKHITPEATSMLSVRLHKLVSFAKQNKATWTEFARAEGVARIPAPKAAQPAKPAQMRVVARR